MADNQLQLVSEEQAVKLKEFGFDWPCNVHMTFKGSKSSGNKKNWNGEKYGIRNNTCTSLPEQALVKQWFEVEKKIFIVVFPYTITDGVIQWAYEIYWIDERSNLMDLRKVNEVSSQKKEIENMAMNVAITMYANFIKLDNIKNGQ